MNLRQLTIGTKVKSTSQSNALRAYPRPQTYLFSQVAGESRWSQWMDYFRDMLVRATGWGQGGQFGHSRAGVRYFHREPTRESSNLQRGGPRSLYFPQPAHNAAPFNLLKILYPDTKLHGHATVETTSKKLACSLWIKLTDARWVKCFSL